MLLVDNGAGSSKVLADEITRIGAKFRVLKNDSVDEIDQYSGIVISGRAVQSRESNAHNSRIIREAHAKGIPVLGICYGAEILALTFGATLSRLVTRRKESRLIEVVKKNRLIAEDSFVAHEAHAFRIATLSPDLERLARSSVSENEAVKHVGAELYGIQFHPELSGESGRRILENFIKLCR